MNSEELELSLRSEFESHLKTVVADLRQEYSQLQERVEAEFEKHKSQMDAVFQDFSQRIENRNQLEAGFSEMVVEHLRLARDEGARISATAFEEAQKMEAETAAAAPPKAGINELSAAISEITAQDSQATILKSLVHHAAQFTPRGAFFIIKNEHFVGWRVFGKEGDSDEQAVREVFFPVASSTALGESVRSLSAVESSYGSYSDDSIYLNKLGFGQPDRMYAIPLIARGRGVAVLYADYGSLGEEVNVEALETLVRVAGLTVEVLAAAPAARAVQEFQPASEERYTEPAAAENYVEPTEEYQSATDQTAAEQFAETQALEESEEYSTEPVSEQEESEQEYQQDYQSAEETEPTPEIYTEETYTQEVYAPEVEPERAPETYASEEPETEQAPEVYAAEVEVVEETSWSKPEEEVKETVEEVEAEQTIPEQYQFDEPDKVEETPTESVPEKEEEIPVATPSFEPMEKPAVQESYSNGRAEAFEPTPEPVVPAATPTPTPTRSRFSDRNVDLPIEVGEDERRLHNDARRFARLLVSEIKLYNEQKVREGREAQDLYERLREAIDRSRDMYDKRVQPPVAAKFDYFHYELVSSLAEGDDSKLGGTYPGATV